MALRAFIAVGLPEPVQRELSLLQAAIPKSLGVVVPAKGFHLTLKFLGEVGEDKAALVCELLSSINHQAFEASLSGMGFFPGENYVRVVWIGAAPKSEFISLQQKVEAALQGLFPEEKDFVPHITLARVKFLEDKQQFLNVVKELEPPRLSFRVDRIALKKSTLGRGGPVYEDVAVFPF